MVDYKHIIRKFSSYLLTKFIKKEKLFLNNDLYYRVFLGIVFNLGISLPKQKTKTDLLSINDFVHFYKNLLLFEHHNCIDLNFNIIYIGNSTKIVEINHFIQKLYNEDYFETFFTDIELDLINDYEYDILSALKYGVSFTS